VNLAAATAGGAVGALVFFNAGTAREISISDVDAAGTDTFAVQLTASDSNADLTLSQTSGLSGDIDGADGVLDFTGTLVDVNAALNDLAYKSSTPGAATLTILSDDQGNNGVLGGNQTDSDDIAINLSQPPTLSVPGSQTVDEDAPLSFGGNISVDDPDTTVLSVTLTVSNGTLTLAGTTGLSGDTDGSDGTLDINGDKADINTALNGLEYLGDSDFNGGDTLDIVVDDGGQSTPGSVSITVSPVNDAPVITGAIPGLNAVTEGDPAPSNGAVPPNATLVNDLVTAGVNATDADGTTSFGIAVTALDTTLGSWFFSTDGGANWSNLGTPSATSARLLFADSDTYVYLQPDGDPTGTITSALTLRLWDRSGADGSPTLEGSTFDVSSNGGESAFSGGAAETLEITVNPATGVTPVDTVNLTALDGSTSGNSAGLRLTDLDISAVGSRARVGSLGDLDADGFSDVLAASEIAGPTNGGQVYVFSGAPSGTLAARLPGTPTDGIPLTSLDGDGAQPGLKVNGEANSDFSGGHVTKAAGDVNGDGFDDLLIAGFNKVHLLSGTTGIDALNDANSLDSGAPLTDAGYDLNNVDGTNGAEFSVPLLTSSERGAEDFAVASTGDVNGDGLDDILIGAATADPAGTTNGGQAYLVLGDDTANLHSKDVTQTDIGILKFNGVDGGRAGSAVSSAGDVDGDGLQDFIIGAPDTGSTGKAYVVLGAAVAAAITEAAGSTANPTPTLPNVFTSGFDLDSLDTAAPAAGFAIDTGALGREIGITVDSAGDFNGDGFEDVIVGSTPNTGGQYGYSAVVYGKASGFGTVEIDTLDGGNGGVIMLGATVPPSGPNALAGEFSSGAGDMNGDGFDDILVSGQGRGETYLFFGNTDSVMASRTTAFSGFDFLIATPTPAPGAPPLDGIIGTRIVGPASSPFGVSAAGDVNGDGFEDAVVLSPVPLASGTQDAYVVYGQNFSGLSTSGVSASSGASDDDLHGGPGPDALSVGSASHTDVGLFGGAGDDALLVNAAMRKVDGGGGSNTVQLMNGVDLDFTTEDGDSGISPSVYRNVGRFDLTANGDHEMDIDVRDLLDLTPSNNRLTVLGDAGDTLNLHDSAGGPAWSAPGSTDGGPGLETFTSSAAPSLQLLVDADTVSVNVI